MALLDGRHSRARLTPPLNRNSLASVGCLEAIWSYGGNLRRITSAPQSSGGIGLQGSLLTIRDVSKLKPFKLDFEIQIETKIRQGEKASSISI
eukprot:3488784-Pyramimonas_sp.AAC.2